MLTRRQQQCLDFIKVRVDEKGSPPTIREIGSHMSILSPNGVICHLTALERKGMIERDPHKSRGIRIAVTLSYRSKTVMRVSQLNSSDLTAAITGKLQDEKTPDVAIRWLNDAITEHEATAE